MERDYTNIYYDARHTTGLTQERWAELLGLSVDSVKQYEAGKITPSDEVVLRMSEAAGHHIICYWHLLHKSRVAGQILPPVERLPLAQAVVQLLARMREFDREHHDDALLTIAEDGRVDPDELPHFKQVVRDLHGIIQAAIQIDYAERETDP